MQFRNKIYSYFLLGIYLVVLVNGVAGYSQLDPVSKGQLSHQHGDFKEAHHDHHFHVGIFHFLGHLFEAINQSECPADKHIVSQEKSKTKKSLDSERNMNLYHNWYDFMLLDSEVRSQSDTPNYSESFSHRLIHFDSYLRGPPSLV